MIESQNDVESISLDILKQSKALDIFPTPIEKIVNYAELSVNTRIDLSKVDQSFLTRLKEESSASIKVLQSGLSKVRGIFDRREKTIYVDLSQNTGRQGFVKLHEIGHGVLPWQNDFALAFDNNETLQAAYEDEFEAEANYFASITLFQHDRFLKELKSLPLGINSAMALSKKFGSSVHSALRNYVTKSHKRCALLVLTPIKNPSGKISICEKRNLFYSESFKSDIGELDLPDEFGFKWSFMRDFIMFKKRFNDKGKITLDTMQEETLDAKYHYFNNGFNIFVLIFPYGEVIKSRTKVILSSALTR